MSELLQLNSAVVFRRLFEDDEDERASSRSWTTTTTESDDDNDGKPRQTMDEGQSSNLRQRRQRSLGGQEVKAAGEQHKKTAAASEDGTDPVEQMLDFSGPELMQGCRHWVAFFRLLGIINLKDCPFYLSLVYRLVVLLLCFVLLGGIFMAIMSLGMLSAKFNNPIFKCCSTLAIFGSSAQFAFSLKISMFDLSPLFKILTTPKLCFIKVEILHKLGNKFFISVFLSQLYNGLVLCMLCGSSLSDFARDFHLPTFLLLVVLQAVVMNMMFGLSFLDFYIRMAFGHWLFALRSHLERRFSRRHQGSSANRSSLEKEDVSSPTLEEIYKSLNNMDDHLEVLRTSQTWIYVFMSVNAFSINGSFLLLVYHVISDLNDFYHAFLLLLLSLEFIGLVFISYSGDQWLNYALSSFVQTIEDEYFMQADKSPDGQTATTGESSSSLTLSTSPTSSTSLAPSTAAASAKTAQQVVPLYPTPPPPHPTTITSTTNTNTNTNTTDRTSRITKTDVIFCREFLCQFENHLATPWSSLNFKSHLHLLRTFVTLLAAQIIFDHDH